MKENNIILIPAHNEGDSHVNRLDPKYKPIRHTLQQIKKAGFKGKVFVVNDGSTDNTSKLAEEGGARVINLEERRGKAAAVFSGLKQIIRLNPTCVILFDADMITITKRDLGRMLELANKATKEGRIEHGVASVEEIGKHFPISEESGIRCFSRKAAIELVRTSKSFVRGYQLEDFLNKLFRNTTTKIRYTDLRANIPFRTELSAEGQSKGRARIPDRKKVRPAQHRKA